MVCAPSIDVSITLHEGEILGLIGPNGSGKSTAVNAMTGVVPAGGSLRIGGQSVAMGNPGRVRRAGVLRTYQTPQTFLHMSCIENVLLTTTDRKYTGIVSSIVLRPLMLKHERERWRHAAAALDRVGLLDRAEESAANLSYGQQRLLEVARAIAGDPKVIMLDEPSAGLNAAETEILAGHLRRLRQDGISLLVIDHKIDFITTLVDRVIVLELGSLVAEGDPRTHLAGSPCAERLPRCRRRRSGGVTMLEIRDLERSLRRRRSRARHRRVRRQR